MECPYCSTELEYHDYFGRLASHQDGKVIGYIYFCPEGREGGDCESAFFNVQGSFYVYNDAPDIIHDGYPC